MLKRLCKLTAMATLFPLSVVLLPFTSQAKVSLPDYLYSHYELSPAAVKDAFINDGWDLEYVRGDELNNLYCTGVFAARGYTISGVTVYDLKTIYLSDEYGYAETALNHEMGHFLDYAYYTYYGVQPSRTDNFLYIYSQEARASYLYENYELSDITEYFAQSYWSYVEDKDDLRTFYPLTYQYIDGILADFDYAVYAGYNPVYDDGVFMMASHPTAPQKPNTSTKAVAFNKGSRKIDTTGIPLLKELVEKVP